MSTNSIRAEAGAAARATRPARGAAAPDAVAGELFADRLAQARDDASGSSVQAGVDARADAARARSADATRPGREADDADVRRASAERAERAGTPAAGSPPVAPDAQAAPADGAVPGSTPPAGDAPMAGTRPETPADTPVAVDGAATAQGGSESAERPERPGQRVGQAPRDDDARGASGNASGRAAAQGQAQAAATLATETAQADPADETTHPSERPAKADASRNTTAPAVTSDPLATPPAGLLPPVPTQANTPRPLHRVSGGNALTTASQAPSSAASARPASDAATGTRAQALPDPLAPLPRDPATTPARFQEFTQALREAAAPMREPAPAPSALPSALQAGAQAPLQTAAADDMVPTYATVPVPVTHPQFAPALTARVVDFVARGIERAEVTVTPPELGPVRIGISVVDGETRVDFSAAHAETVRVLQDAMPGLRQTLADGGLRLSDDSRVELADRRATGGDAAGGGQGRGDTRDGAPRRAQVSVPGADPARTASPTSLRTAAGRVDLYA